ncbi:MAG: tetratricopeptide repeat protein [bacterium]
MKRIAIMMGMILIISITFGQKNVRQTASNYLKAGKLDKALEAINQCIKEPTTAEDSRTWFIRGNIYLEIANSTDPTYQALDADPITQAMESYKKAIEFDTKKEFYEDIFAKLNWQRNNLYNQAVDAYNKQDYALAMKYFAGAAQAISAAKVADTVGLLNAAYCATLAKDYSNAKKFYIELLNNKYKSVVLLISLSDIYRIEKDYTNAMKYIEIAKQEYPSDSKVSLGETSIYLTFDMTDKALSNLLVYIATDTLNYSVYFALGTIYDRMANDSTLSDTNKLPAFNDAIAAYKKTLELNPEYFDAYYNIGALCVNKAALIDLEANKLPLEESVLFEKLKGEANSYLIMAAPYLEKAIMMQPNDLNTLQTLRQIYVRTNQTVKLKEINEIISSISH